MIHRRQVCVARRQIRRHRAAAFLLLKTRPMRSSTRFEAFALVAAALLWRPAPSHAQQPQAGFQDGFFIESPDGNTRLNFGLVAQTDGRFSVDDPLPITNTFTTRKFRPSLTGRIAKYFDFKMNPDFGSGTVVVEDAYFDILFSTKLRVRTGKDKTPVGYELLIGDGYLLFPERSLASSLVPNRDTGFQVQGDANRISYAAGVFNGVPDGSSSTTELDTNSAKDLAGRITLNPFKSARSPHGVIDGLGFQLGGSTGAERGTLPVFKTSAQQTYFSYASGAAASGTRSRITPAAFYYHKAFGGYTEYVRSAQPITRSGIRSNVVNHAWEASASYLLTGEDASAGIVRPRHDFDPSSGQWGALQLVARAAALTVDRDAFPTLAAPGSSREAQSFTVGANWYPNAYVKFYGTFERTVFDRNASGARPAEDVIIFRGQLAF